MHSNIVESFDDELRAHGFEANAGVRGGAHMRQDKEGNIVIYDKSVDYGECDKDVAQKLVSRAFPDKKVLIERESRGGGW